MVLMNYITPWPFYLFFVSTFTTSANRSRYNHNFPHSSNNVQSGEPLGCRPSRGIPTNHYYQNIARPGSGDNEKEPILDSGLEPSKRKIWGMKKKTFMIMLGIFILLIIAVAVAKAKNDNNRCAPRIAKPVVHQSKALTWRQNSLSPTSSSGHAPLVTITPSISSSPTPTPIRRNTPLAAVNWNTSYIQLFYKHTDGSIRFQENKGLRWGEQSPQVTKPKDDSGLAAMGWLVGDVRQVCTASITPPLLILILCFRYECIPRVKTTL